MVCVFPWSDKDQPAPVLILLKCTVHRSPPQSWQATSAVSRLCSEGGQKSGTSFTKYILENALKELSLSTDWVISWKLGLISHFFTSKVSSITLKKKTERKARVRIATACSYSYVHMKLMLFTDFLQTHQSNLRLSDRFPLLDSTKNIFLGGGGVMQTPATTTGSEEGLEISQNHRSSHISQGSLLWVLDKERACEELNGGDLALGLLRIKGGRTHRCGLPQQQGLLGYCAAREVVSSLVEARRQSQAKSTQAHTHTNKWLWGVLECNSGGDESHPRVQISRWSCAPWSGFLNMASSDLRHATCWRLQCMLLVFELQNLEESPNKKHTEQTENSQIHRRCNRRSITDGFKIWAPLQTVHQCNNKIELKVRFHRMTLIALSH